MTLDEGSTWLLALEACLLDGTDEQELISITRGRLLPEEHRAEIWHICLGGGNKISTFEQFDEIFDLPEQSIIRSDCKALVDKLGNDEEDKVSVLCDVESVFTHFCKTRHLKYETSHGWADLVTPLLASKFPRNHLYVSFENILEKYIPRELQKGSPVYHLLRLLLLYHEPELSTFLDSKKITPDLFATSWLRSLFVSVCNLSAVVALWDIYIQERDPFFVLFLTLVILVNAKEKIMEMFEEPREMIVQTLANAPTALNVDDVPDFCSLARYYNLKTPHTFKKEFATVIFGSVYMGHGSEGGNGVGDLPLSQALCLPVSVDEILDACDSDMPGLIDVERVRFFLVDCRPSEQYNAGHLPNAFHLDSSLMLQQPSTFQTAVQGLFMVQKQALASHMPGCGSHLCFVGSGREQEDLYLHMVVASFLQRNTMYVSLVKGGYQAIHDVLVHSASESLSDHDSKKCLVCCPNAGSYSPSEIPLGGESEEWGPQQSVPPSGGVQVDSFRNRLSLFSSSFVSKSSTLKEKLIDYISNPYGDSEGKENALGPASGRNVFEIDGDDPDDVGRLGPQHEVVRISHWIKNPDVIACYPCQFVNENGYVHPGYLLVMDSLLFLLRQNKHQPEEGIITRRSLASIVKITSKKKYPELITFKYGFTTGDGEATYTDMDRFLIPNAGEATKVIKQQIMKQLDHNL